MHKIPTDAFDMLVTLEKRPFERAGREVVVRLLDETLPDGTKLVAASDPSYPPELAALEEHPAVLVHEGDLSLTERQLRVSIVGSRDASDSARADARRVARELAARGAVVVSGLAAGIDTAAHEGALEARSPSGTVGRTIAVMGTPLSQPWPPANARLARRIAEYGLLISLAPQVNGLSFTDEERAESLRARNRAIAALGLGSLVMAGRRARALCARSRSRSSLDTPCCCGTRSSRRASRGRSGFLRILSSIRRDARSFRRFRPPRTWRRRCRPGAPSGGFDGRTRREEDGASPEVPESEGKNPFYYEEPAVINLSVGLS